MAANTEILREYLISLGYRVDERSNKKIDNSILRTDLNVRGLAKTVIGAGVALQAFVALWARSMERLYYSSVKAETSAGNLQALSFAASKVGVSGEAMTAAIEGMARAVRLNPGLRAFIESMGISTKGRQMGDVMTDVLKQAAKMPFFQGAGIMEMFGMDADTFFLLSKSVDKLEEAAKLRKQMAEDAGLDVDAAARAGLEYSGMLKDIAEKFGILKDVLGVALLEPAREFAAIISSALTDLSRWIGVKGPELTATVKSATPEGTPYAAYSSAADKARAFFLHWLKGGGTSGPSTPADRRSSGRVTQESSGDGGLFNQGNKSSYLKRLEGLYGLPEGMLDRVWAAESGRGKNLLSPKGAKGDFQFMPATADEYSVDTDDFYSGASGAAQYLRNLLDKFGNDPRKAAAAYNWGQGNLAKVGGDISRAPLETRLYADKVGGAPIVINQQTDIRVSSDNPETAGRQVAREQINVGADLVRTFQGVVQ